ncbi:MAG TPA: SIS domain-containing protein [Thermoplasmata archaeon]|nr:SIS domain-containing protein [Thermoplasmata archaeon]
MASRSPDGLVHMRALATQLPNQLRDGFTAAGELDAPLPRSTCHVYFTGMGGSAIAADLLRALTDPEADLALEVGRGPGLPRSVSKDSVAILGSYSGGTWETLASYDEAKRRGTTRVVLSSGGELARRAQEDGVPHLQLPPGLPPRAAVGYMLGGLLGLLDPFFPESNDERLHRAADRLEALQASYLAPKGPPAKLAGAIGVRTIEAYADHSVAALARRWKDQVEENAKRLAHFDQFPEMFHNAIVGWDALLPEEARRWAAVILEWRHQAASLGPGLDYLESLLKRRRVAVHRVRFEAEDRLEALVTGISFGDHFSLALAEAAGVDPYPIHAISRLKRAVERS